MLFEYFHFNILLRIWRAKNELQKIEKKSNLLFFIDFETTLYLKISSNMGLFIKSIIMENHNFHIDNLLIL